MNNALNTNIGKKPVAKNNLEKFVSLKIAELRQHHLANKFLNLYQNRNTQKVSMRLDSDVLNFYHSFGKGHQTIMRFALKAFKEVYEAGKIKLPE